jgi:hypothetical protein
MSGSSSPPSGDAGGALVLSPLDVSLAAALIVVQALVSLRYKLGLHTQLLIAAVRCILQLSVLGYVLGALCLSCLVALTCDAVCRLPAAADLRVLAFDGAAPLTLLNTLKHPRAHTKCPSLSTTALGSCLRTAASWWACRRSRRSAGRR